MTAPRYRLGAEELIELGDSQNDLVIRNRKPFLAGRIRGRIVLGQAAQPDFMDTLSSVSKDLADNLSKALTTMSSVMNIPVQTLAQSVENTANAAIGLLDSCPTMKNVMAQVLLLGGALVKYGLSIPDLGVQGLGIILAGLDKAMTQKLSAGDIETAVTKAKEDILAGTARANMEAKNQVLEASGVSGSNLTPSVSESGQPMAAPAGTSAPLSSAAKPGGGGLETALAVGTVGAVALVTALVSK